MRGEYETAAPFIGFAVVLDMLDGRIARLTGTTSAFGVEFDSLADVISFGIAPAILSFSWGLSRSAAWAGRPASCSWRRRRCGSRASTFKAAAATSAISSACRVRRRPPSRRRRCSRIPSGSTTTARRCRRCDGARAGGPDGQHDPVPQLQDHRLAGAPAVHRADLIAGGIMLIATHPRFVLVALAYSYLASAFIGMAIAGSAHRRTPRRPRAATREPAEAVPAYARL